MNEPHNRQVILFISLVCIAHAIVIFSARLLPFQDLPNHLAEATVFKMNMQTNDFLNGYYESVPWYFPNTLHSVFCSLFSNIEFGNKVFYVLYVMLFSVAIYLIVNELKGNTWYALLSFLFIYGYNVTYGFCGFTIAIPTLLLFFILLLADARKEKASNKILASFILVLLFFMHAQVALLALVLYSFMMLYRFGRDIKKLLIRSVFIPLPVVLMVFIWWLKRTTEKEESTIVFLKHYYSTEYLKTIWKRLGIVVFDNYQLADGLTGWVIGIFFFSLVLIPLAYFMLSQKKRDPQKFRTQEFVYPMLFLLTVLSCYIFLPDRLPGQAPMYERFATVVILVSIIVGSVLLKHLQIKWLKFYVIAAVTISSAIWFEYIYAFNRENRQFNAELFSGLKKNERLGGLIYDYNFRGRKLYLHFPSYQIVWNKGLAATMIIEFRFGVVRRAAKGRLIPVYYEWIGIVYKEEPQYDSLLEYQLVRGKAGVPHDRNLDNFYPVKQAERWYLYKNKNRIAPAE